MSERQAPRRGQTSASSKRAVKRQKRKAEDRRAEELDSLRAVLASPEGRSVIYRLLERAGCFRSVFSERPNLLPYLAGRQDFGHYIMGEVEAAEPEALFHMMVEAKAEQRAREAEDAAEHTPGVDDDPDDDDE